MDDLITDDLARAVRNVMYFLDGMASGVPEGQVNVAADYARELRSALAKTRVSPSVDGHFELALHITDEVQHHLIQGGELNDLDLITHIKKKLDELHPEVANKARIQTILRRILPRFCRHVEEMLNKPTDQVRSQLWEDLGIIRSALSEPE